FVGDAPTVLLIHQLELSNGWDLLMRCVVAALFRAFPNAGDFKLDHSPFRVSCQLLPMNLVADSSNRGLTTCSGGMFWGYVPAICGDPCIRMVQVGDDFG
ncbi:MAG: hypothetical protein L7U72_16345, partial [Rubripirellula sp.]|nr:hypothetical protein [Rubripirellula sp.]